jgi:hypothetical protein
VWRLKCGHFLLLFDDFEEDGNPGETMISDPKTAKFEKKWRSAFAISLTESSVIVADNSG